MLDMVSAEEKELIDLYRKTYGFSYGASSHGDFSDCDFFLRLWAQSKNMYLRRMFGDQLILERDFSYTRSEDEIEEDIRKMFCQGYGRKNRLAKEFKNNFLTFCDSAQGYEAVKCEHFSHNSLYSLISTDSLMDNCYRGDEFTITLPNGKDYKVRYGAKIMRVLGKIANAFNISGFEDFRICHSMAIGQKKMTGKMCLSIHPLDYITMSDNDCGWESCMSWRNEGGYRQGTVEMMNSPSVIVAYLASDEDFQPLNDNKHFWNNKKWRQLFIIDHNVIIGVKEYPFENRELSTVAAEWIKELAKTAWNWTYGNFFTYLTETAEDEDLRLYQDHLSEEKNGFIIEVDCGYMYNDFGCANNGHLVALNPNIDEEDIETREYSYYKQILPIAYSGMAECVICGNKHIDLDNESCLACEECQTLHRCDCCGDVLYSEPYEVDGMILCESCYNVRAITCDICNETHYEDTMERVYIIPRLSNETKIALKERYKETYGRYGMDDSLEYIYMPGRNQINVCTEHLEEWINKYMMPNERPYLIRRSYQKINCVYYDQLTAEAQKSYLMDVANNEDYISLFSIYDVYPTSFIRNI